MNQRLNIDDTTCNTMISIKKDFKVDLRSKSQGQMSRSNMQFCKQLGSTINHEAMIGDLKYSYA